MAHNAERRGGVKRQKDYTLYLDQMIEYMEECKTEFDITFEEFRQNGDLILSGMKRIEIIGEAANRIPGSIKEKYVHLEIPWKDMRDMRNELIHDDNILLPKLWETIKEDMPKTLPKVQEMRRLEELRMKKVRNREKRNQDGMEG